MYTDTGGLPYYAVDGGPLITATTCMHTILKVAKPTELPVQQPTPFMLAVNMKTANFLGFTIPSTVVVHADKVNKLKPNGS